MTIASVGTLGSGANSSSNSSYTFNTATNTLADGDFAILISVSDNTSTVDGSNNEHTSVTGLTGTWTKLGEYTNTVGGAAADGVTTSLWLFQATGTVSTGSTVTLNFTSNRTDKCCSFWKFTKAAGYNVKLDTAPATNPLNNVTDASNGFGSQAFSGLASASRLYVRGLGKEANTTTDITPSTNFTAMTATRSRNNTNAVIVRGEFRVNTSTGETSNPTLAVSGDTAAVFAALVEYLADRSATFAATESGADTFAATGAVAVTGDLAATETGPDGYSSYAHVEVAVRFGAQAHPSGGMRFGSQLYADIVAGVTGTLAATESGSDTAAVAGVVTVTGTSDIAESGADTAAAAGAVLVSGSMAASESGSDTLAISGAIQVQGHLDATESGADTAALAGAVAVTGGASIVESAANETGADTLDALASVEVAGDALCVEVGEDSLAADGGLSPGDITGNANIIEAADRFIARGSLIRTEHARRMMREMIFVGRNNRNVIRLGQEGLALDFGGVTRMVLSFEGSAVRVDSALTPELISWDLGGIVSFALGKVAIKPSKYWVSITAYDAAHDDGQLVIDAADRQLQCWFITA